jgi:hypothetical protein
MAKSDSLDDFLSVKISGVHPRVEHRAAEIYGVRPGFNGRDKRVEGSGGSQKFRLTVYFQDSFPFISVFVLIFRRKYGKILSARFYSVIHHNNIIHQKTCFVNRIRQKKANVGKKLPAR